MGGENSEADERGANWEDDLSQEDSRWQLTRRVENVNDIATAVFYLAKNDGVPVAELIVDRGVRTEEEGVP